MALYRDLSNPPCPDVLAFLEAIKDAPDDDGPRLVFADWLDENGDARGEFLRLQTLRNSVPRRDPRWAQCCEAEERLKKRYHDHWFGPLKHVIEDWQFRRGLLWVWMTAMNFFSLRMQYVGLSEAWAWVDGLRISGWLPDQVERFAECELLAGLNVLDIDKSLGDDGLTALAASPHLGRVAALDIDSTQIGPDGMHGLNAARHLGQLRSLDLRCNRLGQLGLEALVSGPLLKQLTHLDLGYNGLGAAGAETLAGARSAAGLTSLRLGYNLVGNRGAAALAASPQLASLTNLELCSAGLTDVGGETLAYANSLPGLVTMNLRGNPFSVSVASRLRGRYGEGLQL